MLFFAPVLDRYLRFLRRGDGYTDIVVAAVVAMACIVVTSGVGVLVPRLKRARILPVEDRSQLIKREQTRVSTTGPQRRVNVADLNESATFRDARGSNCKFA